jgi:hypothetical protein
VGVLTVGLERILDSSVYSAFAVCVLMVHALFILWVIFGALITRSRPLLRWLHILSLIWGILIELLPWSCPLTLLENWLEGRGGIEPYQGGFLLHYLDKLVYPDLSVTLLVTVGVLVCAFNLALYVRQFWISSLRKSI